MSQRPTVSPNWATGGSATVEEPSLAKRALGFIKEPLPYAWLNSLFNTLGLWIDFLNKSTVVGFQTISDGVSDTAVGDTFLYNPVQDSPDPTAPEYYLAGTGTWEVTLSGTLIDSVATDGENVYFVEGNNCHAYSQDGTLLWTRSNLFTSGAGTPSATDLACDGRAVWVVGTNGSGAGEAYALNRSDGLNAIAAPLVLGGGGKRVCADGELVYIAYGTTGVAAYAPAIGGSWGFSIWSITLPNTVNAIDVNDSGLYIAYDYDAGTSSSLRVVSHSTGVGFSGKEVDIDGAGGDCKSVSVTGELGCVSTQNGTYAISRKPGGDALVTGIIPALSSAWAKIACDNDMILVNVDTAAGGFLLFNDSRVYVDSKEGYAGYTLDAGTAVAIDPVNLYIAGKFNSGADAVLTAFARPRVPRQFRVSNVNDRARTQYTVIEPSYT